MTQVGKSLFENHYGSCKVGTIESNESYQNHTYVHIAFYTYMFYNPFRAESFEWDEEKNLSNIDKHGICFEDAQKVFLDQRARIFKDLAHSTLELRFFCIGKVNDQVVSVRFTYRGKSIRIIGAGYWRKGKKLYEEKQRLY